MARYITEFTDSQESEQSLKREEFHRRDVLWTAREYWQRVTIAIEQVKNSQNSHRQQDGSWHRQSLPRPRG